MGKNRGGKSNQSTVKKSVQLTRRYPLLISQNALRAITAITVLIMYIQTFYMSSNSGCTSQPEGGSIRGQSGSHVGNPARFRPKKVCVHSPRFAPKEKLSVLIQAAALPAEVIRLVRDGL
jgi:hypothetical protein